MRAVRLGTHFGAKAGSKIGQSLSLLQRERPRRCVFRRKCLRHVRADSHRKRNLHSSELSGGSDAHNGHSSIV